MTPSCAHASWMLAIESARDSACLNSGIAFVGEMRVLRPVVDVPLLRSASTSRPERGLLASRRCLRERTFGGTGLRVSALMETKWNLAK